MYFKYSDHGDILKSQRGNNKFPKEKEINNMTKLTRKLEAFFEDYYKSFSTK